MFSIGTKIYETNANGDSLRTLYDNSDQDLVSFDYNSKTNIFYFADDKNNKVITYLNYWKSSKSTRGCLLKCKLLYIGRRRIWVPGTTLIVLKVVPSTIYGVFLQFWRWIWYLVLPSKKLR